MLEVRGHARGGQGMVTAFEILAKIFSQSGEYRVQAFPFFGVERTGAPIMAFFRVAKGEILNRSNIYHPHLVVVFDETVIDMVPVFDGLRKGGAILLNTENDRSQYADQAECVYTVPATRISLEKGLGSKSLPIVNASMIGAVIRILDGDMELAKKVIYENVPAKNEENAAAAEMAYNSVVGLEVKNNLARTLSETVTEIDTGNGMEVKKSNIASLDDITRVPFWEKPMTQNKTGNWRVMMPTYITREAPCTSNCPAGTDVRLFVKQASEKQFDEAFQTIYDHNPFPSTCGRVCPHFCQHGCNRAEFDEHLNIGAIERFLGDHGITDNVKPTEISRKEKIAVIGSGPAGLTCALRMRQQGFSTTVFEALPKAGGMMRVGIPQFRLPEEALDKEISMIEKQGVEIITGKRVNVNELENDYDAVIVATGLHISSSMRLDNEELALEGLPFLNDFKINGEKHGISKGDKVAVIGGGNTAVDVARTALRLGAEATIYYRRTEKEMPAIAHEVQEASNEGVTMELLTAPTAIEQNSNGTINLTMIKMELGEPDDSGRRRPVPVEGSETTLEVNKVIKAIGQWNDPHAFLGKEIEAKQGANEYNTNVPVFCCGDMAWGGTVTEAIGSGNEAAKEVAAFLNNKTYNAPPDYEGVVEPGQLNFNYYKHVPSHHNPQHDASDLFNNLSEAVLGLSKEQVVDEAMRCLHCGECYNCGNCINYCPDSAIHFDEQGQLYIDYDFCKGCGICFIECPCSAIKFNLEEEEVVHA